MWKLLAQVSIDANKVGLPKVAANESTWANIIGGIFIFTGAWATLFIVIGAIRYAVSGGDQGAITRAKDTILYAIVGLVVSILAFTGVQFVLGRF